MPITGPISLKKLQTEFGGSGRLSEYVRGGSLVPDAPANSNVSANAVGLHLSSFLNAAKTASALTLAYVPTQAYSSTTTNTASGTYASAIYTFTANGGSGNYSYAFSLLTGNNNAAIQTTSNTVYLTVQFTGMLPGSTRTGSGVIRCVVTDTTTNQTTSIDLPLVIDIERLDAGGGL
jgi:hypothetical protein